MSGLGTEYTYVGLTLTCAVCGASLGEAYRLAGQHPQAGQELTQGLRGEVAELDDGNLEVRTRCLCSSSASAPWSTVATALDELDHRSRPFGSLIIGERPRRQR